MRPVSVCLAPCLAALAGPVAAQSNPYCQNATVIGRTEGSLAPGLFEYQARNLAWTNWEGNCDRRFPARYCVKRWSKVIKEDCGQVPNGLGGYNWSCEVRAQPCRSS